MSTRRKGLEPIRYAAGLNAGLWLDKFIVDAKRQQRGNEEQGTAQSRVVDEVANLRVSELYPSFFARWSASLAMRRAETRHATVLGRMVVGLGAESVLETAIALHRTYSVPLIPGSALKGLAAATARQHFGEDWRAPAEPWNGEHQPAGPSSAYELMFGSTTTAGYLTFFDALYIPRSAPEDRPLAADVFTVHHRNYYGGTPPAAPADWDSPVPVPFVSAGGAYLVALAGPPAWVETALQLLGWGCMHSGVGAKTSSGYGRLLLAGVTLPTTQPTEASSAPTQVNTQPVAASRSTRPIPGIGVVFAGKLVERGDKAIVIAVPGHRPEEVLAVLEVLLDTPSWRVGDLARVEVVQVELREQRTILIVRRAPREKKS